MKISIGHVCPRNKGVDSARSILYNESTSFIKEYHYFYALAVIGGKSSEGIFNIFHLHQMNNITFREDKLCEQIVDRH